MISFVHLTGHFKFEIFGTSDVGDRDEQQDAWVILHTPDASELFIVVADGAGGMSGGRAASQAVAEAAKVFWQDRIREG